jgi:hypothetical protein
MAKHMNMHVDLTKVLSLTALEIEIRWLRLHYHTNNCEACQNTPNAAESSHSVPKAFIVNAVTAFSKLFFEVFDKAILDTETR